MSRLSRRVEKFVRQRDLARHVPSSTTYEGSHGLAWFVGSVSRAPSIAEFYCGDDVKLGSVDRVARRSIPEQIERVAIDGGLSVLSVPNVNAELSAVLGRSIEVPTLVDIHIDLPSDANALRDELKTSTTREDLRRIRKAGFTYRTTTDPEVIREFHGRFYTPLVEAQFPEDGRIGSVDRMVADLSRGGELICADADDDWVAGIFNHTDGTAYALGALGIRDADDSIRQKRVVAALIVRSLERGVELGLARATLGRSLPFLGKGPLWFKMKWGGVISRRPGSKLLNIFMNLKNEAARGMLARSPIIHADGDSLAASAWLEPGEKPLHDLVRDSSRFPGISTWNVLGEAATLNEGRVLLATRPQLVPLTVDLNQSQHVWLGEVLSGTSSSV